MSHSDQKSRGSDSARRASMISYVGAGEHDHPSVPSLVGRQVAHMCDTLPEDLKARLHDRVRRANRESEVLVPAAHQFTLPSIRAQRIAERDDEPELSLSSIREFVELIQEAEVQSIRVERFEPSRTRYGACPAAVVIAKVRYNGCDIVSEFGCIWVYSRKALGLPRRSVNDESATVRPGTIRDEFSRSRRLPVAVVLKEHEAIAKDLVQRPRGHSSPEFMTSNSGMEPRSC